MIIGITFHKDGISGRGILCSIMIEDHPTFALNKAYALLRDIMPNDVRWYITKIHYFPDRVDSKSRLSVEAGLKDWPLE